MGTMTMGQPEQLTLQSATPEQVKRLDTWEKLIENGYLHHIASRILRDEPGELAEFGPDIDWYASMRDHLAWKYPKVGSNRCAMAVQYVMRQERGKIEGAD